MFLNHCFSKGGGSRELNVNRNDASLKQNFAEMFPVICNQLKKQ